MGIGFKSKKTRALPILKQLECFSSIICVVSSADSPDIIVEDIVALSSLSPGSKITLISDSEIGGVFDAVSNVQDIFIIPGKENNVRRSAFLKKCSGVCTDILYCRKAIEDSFTRDLMSRINASVTIVFGKNVKTSVLNGQIIRVEDDNSNLSSVMSFVPEVKIEWEMSSEILQIVNNFLRERRVKKNYFCVDLALEEDYYGFFSDYPDDSVTFLFVGNSELNFSNEGSKIIYTGDISQSYLSGLVSLSKGSFIKTDDLLLTETKHFEKHFAVVRNQADDDVKIKNFIDRNK